MKLTAFPALALGVALVVTACSGDQSPPATPTPAGSTTRVDFTASPAPPAGAGIIRDVRIGAHPENGGFDRLVFEFEVGTSSGWVGYVDEDEIRSCGPGELVPLQGEAALKVHLDSAAQHEDGQTTAAPRQLPGTGNSVREAVLICDFEAVVEWGVGASGIKPFTVTTLSDPPRLVIDIRW
ncbi:MAG TPA: hypothetical protein VG845_04465 [Dehalococcoidia bacterium]|nr:hypothetical protein [Dehalococcoidia bacterium]